MKSFYEFYQQVYNELAPASGQTLGMKDPVEFDKFKAIKPLAAAAAVGGQLDGNPKDDAVQAVQNTKGPVVNLRPTQSTLVSDKVLNFALAHLSGTWMNLVEMEAIVSGDNAIMDGHHRWAAALLVDPSLVVNYAKIMLPLEKLISILNLYSVGKLNVPEGNKADGESIAGAFQNLLEKIPAAFKDGFQSGKSAYSPEAIKKIFATMPGADGNPEEGMRIMVKNCKAALGNSDLMKSATSIDRKQMPVINKDQVAGLIEDLTQGNVDHNSPLSQAVLQAMKGGSGPAKPTPQAEPGAPAAGGSTPPSGAPKPPGAPAGALTPPGAPPAQNASTEYFGFTMLEQAMILSGLASTEQIERKKK